MKGSKGVMFLNRENKNAVCFVDTGKRLNIYRDDSNVVAAMQLASQKWGAIA